MDGVFEHDSRGSDPWSIARELAHYVAKFPELENVLKSRYKTASGKGRAMFEYLFGEIGDEDDLLAMIGRYAADERPYDHRMYEAVYSVSVHRIAEFEGSNSYTIHPASVGSLREKLFGMLSGNKAEAALARKCLLATDHLRDEYGVAANDPRHPDVMSDKPWPEESG